MSLTALTRGQRQERTRTLVHGLSCFVLVLVAPVGAKAGENNWLGTPESRRIAIEISAENIGRLRVASRQDVPATIDVLGGVFREVGVHIKGSGTFQSIDEKKPSFTLDFSEFRPGQSLNGIRKFHLNNSLEDATYLKEQLGSELFRASGVPAPRVTHASVRLNGRALGVYVVKEGVTEDFLARHFEGGTGNLYDTEAGHDIDLPMKRHQGRSSDADAMDLTRLASAAVEPDLSRRWQRLHEILDVDKFVSFMAMEVMLCHWDGYCLGRNNFRVYNDPKRNKMVFLPGGMDQLFGKPDLTWTPEMAGVLARAIMEVPEGRREYENRFRTLLRQVFISERLTNRVNALLAALRPVVRTTEFREICAETLELCARITAREAHLKKQLDEPGPGLPTFDGGVASIDGWKPADEASGGHMQQTMGAEGKALLKIVAGPRTSASWRSTVRLGRGRYQFRGEAKVDDVRPLPFGAHQGACLRIAGKRSRSQNLLGTSAWEALKIEFDVTEQEEMIVLICELRSAGGQASFLRESLMLERCP